jgi:hypothetical protein
LPGVAAVEQQRIARAALRTHFVDERLQMGKAADGGGGDGEQPKHSPSRRGRRGREGARACGQLGQRSGGALLDSHIAPRREVLCGLSPVPVAVNR